MRQPRIFLIGIGAQKAGTTWLGRYLRGHPQVFMSPIKEMHFWNGKFAVAGEDPAELRFAVKLTRSMRRREAGAGRPQPTSTHQRDLEERLGMGSNESAYFDFFAQRAGDLDVWAEITPAYSILDRTAYAAMAGISPATRFLFVMRNPVDRYWSQLRFTKRTQPDLDIFAVFDEYMQEPKFRLRTDYRRTLTEFQAAVPREKLFLEFFERLFTDAAVQRFCGFLSVSAFAADFSPRGETAAKASMTEDMRARAFREFANVYRFVDEFFEGDIPQSWRDDMRRYG